MTVKSRLEKGAAELIKAVEDLSKLRPYLIADTLVDDMKNFVTFSLSLFQKKEAEEYFQGLQQEKTLQEICHISDATIESLYQAAKYLYDTEHYEEAANAFAVMTVLNGKRYTFWLALGNAEYVCRRYEPALLAYAMATLLNPLELTCHLQSCRCYEALQQTDNAINALELALLAIGDDRAQFAMKEKIIQHKRSLLEKNKK